MTTPGQPGKDAALEVGLFHRVTNDWIYFNLRTGESFNTYTVNKDIKEGRTNQPHGLGSGFLRLLPCVPIRVQSGIGRGGAAGHRAMAVTMTGRAFHNCLPTGAWVVDTDDGRHHVAERLEPLPCGKQSDFDANPWFDPNNGPANTGDQCQPAAVAGHELLGPPHIHPFVPHCVVRTADGGGTSRYRLSVGNNANVEIPVMKVRNRYCATNEMTEGYDGTIRALYALLQPAVGEMAIDYRLPDGDNGRPPLSWQTSTGTAPRSTFGSLQLRRTPPCWLLRQL